MLKARVVTALLLVAGLFAVLFVLPRLASDIAFAVVAALAGWEWGGLVKQGQGGRATYGVFVFLSCLLVSFLPTIPWLWLAAAAFWLVAAPLWLGRRWTLAANRSLALAVGWLLIVPTWLAMVELHGRSPWTLLAAMALVWIADTAAYFSGRAFGRRKLAPAISPGKTWEGVGGALAAVLVYGTILMTTTQPLIGIPPWAAAAALVLLTAVSIEGDLFESLAKRQAGVKDSSSLLPGHGGVLDRIDSQLSTLPLVALIFHWRGV